MSRRITTVEFKVFNPHHDCKSYAVRMEHTAGIGSVQVMAAVLDDKGQMTPGSAFPFAMMETVDLRALGDLMMSMGKLWEIIE